MPEIQVESKGECNLGKGVEVLVERGSEEVLTPGSVDELGRGVVRPAMQGRGQEKGPEEGACGAASSLTAWTGRCGESGVSLPRPFAASSRGAFEGPCEGLGSSLGVGGH